MKPKLHYLLIVLALIAGVYQAAAQGTRFFRLSGPANTTIKAFRLDGTLVWSNALAGTNYTVQTVTSLPGGTNWVDFDKLSVTTAINTNLLIAFNPPAGMTLIPAGSFRIGYTLDFLSDAIPTNVTVSAFYMDVNLVSYSQWQLVYSFATNHGYHFFQDPFSGAYAAAGKAANHPVYNVNWFDSLKWCNARSQQAGLAPVYYTDVGLTKVYTNGDYPTTVYPNWATNGYRLPTEAEWEKAERGGLSGLRFPWGDTISESQANYQGIAPGPGQYDLGPAGYNAAFTNGGYPYTSPVGYFAPNNYGLYDTAGNVEEWCWDWYSDNMSSAGSPYAGGSDPRGPASSPYASRVQRGGDWGVKANSMGCAVRHETLPYSFDNNTGFRCVRGL